ncbi:MAG: CvpA family protein [Gammaproteobacteria bacterium]|nr:CvpA family protein [Gammaproteobacteria bacterium]
MTYVDFIILGIVLLSAVISVLRGFVKEAVSLASWVLAFWVSATFAGKLSGLLPDAIAAVQLRVALSFAILFLATLLVGGLANFLISSLVLRSGLSGTDRALGVVFGVLRGVVVVAVLVLLAGLTTVTQESVWTDSLLVENFQLVAVWIRDYLPQDVAKNFVF